MRRQREVVAKAVATRDRLRRAQCRVTPPSAAVIARDRRVDAIVRRSGRRGGMVVRAALASVPVVGVGAGGAWVPGQAAPQAMQLCKRRVPGRRIVDNRKQDNPVRAAQLLPEDLDREVRELGTVPLDTLQVASSTLQRMWTAHAEWAVCLGDWAAAYALERGAFTPETKRRAKEELFKAHKMVGRVAARIRLHLNDPMCLLEVPGARDGARHGAAPGAELPPPVLSSEERLEALMKVTDPALSLEARQVAVRVAAMEQQRVAAQCIATMRTPTINRALDEEHLSQVADPRAAHGGFACMLEGGPSSRHGAVGQGRAQSAHAPSSGSRGITVNGVPIGVDTVRRALMDLRGGQSSPSPLMLQIGGRVVGDGEARRALQRLATACRQGRISTAQLARAKALTDVLRERGDGR